MQLKRSHLILVFSALLALHCASDQLHAATITAVANGYWTNTATWSPAVLPAAADDVVINSGVSVILDQDSPPLASATVNGTLTFQQWNTTLTSGVVTINGNVTHDIQPATTTNASGEWPRDHRVRILCGQLTVATNGTINANSKGYQTFNDGAWWHTGRGPGGGVTAGGGGYGGRGGRSVRSGSTGGPPYGAESQPDWPGSSGACYGSLGGTGGGAIWIEAAGQVVAYGSITANGANGHLNNGGVSGGGGAGGAVYISAQTITGTGRISADGGSGSLASWSGGGGAGGRIDIVYDAGAQAGATAELSLSAAGGMSRIGASGASEIGRPGTIRIPDTSLLRSEAMQGGSPRIAGFETWTVQSLTISNGLLSFPAAFTLTITSNLTIIGTGGIELTNSNLSVNGDVSIQTTHELAATHLLRGAHQIGGALDMQSATLYLADGSLRVDDDMTANASKIQLTGNVTNYVALSVEKELLLTNASTMTLTCGVMTGAPPDVAAQVSAGSMQVLGNSWVYPVSHSTNGASARFEIGTRMVVSAGSGFDANSRGYARDAGLGMGGYNHGVGSGGGHGGKGGNGYRKSTGVPAIGGPAYGVSNAPVQPGSGGRSYGVGADGGGLIWIYAPKAKVEINGTLRANGGNVTSSSGGGGAGGGSGGAIHIHCRTLEGAGTLSATGGHGFDGGDCLGGSGAGGRIAVHRVKHLWTGSPQPDQPDNRVAGGAITHADWPGTLGEDGAIVWILLPRGGLSMKFH